MSPLPPLISPLPPLIPPAVCGTFHAQVFEEMKRAGVEADTVTFNALILACERGRDDDGASIMRPPANLAAASPGGGGEGGGGGGGLMGGGGGAQIGRGQV